MLLSPNVVTTISKQPSFGSTCVGADTLAVQASGVNLAYTWQLTTDTTKSWTTITNAGTFSGATTNRLAISSNAGLSGTYFQVKIQGDCGPGLFSKPALLSLTPLPTFTTQPASTTSCTLPITLTSVSTGSNLAYAWQVATDTTQAWSDLPQDGPYAQTNSAKLLINAVPSTSKLYFRVTATGLCGATTSHAAKLSPCCAAATYNIITANGDGKNDEFFVASSCDFESFSMQVYNRWGRKVFSSSDASHVWNGAGDSKEAAGTYFYHITFTTGGQKTEKKGYVELVK